ncbi:MAG TPA: hypothetical protein VK084_05400 [Chitinophagaceae bacterium]|nr:hypothetical protein [Chitinophagaceae bacterium]
MKITKRFDKQGICDYISNMPGEVTLSEVIAVLQRLEIQQAPAHHKQDSDGNPIINKQTVLEALDRMPNDVSMAEMLDTVDTLYHLKKSLYDTRPAIPHEQAKQLMAERLKQKDAESE